MATKIVSKSTDTEVQVSKDGTPILYVKNSSGKFVYSDDFKDKDSETAVPADQSTSQNNNENEGDE